MSYTFTPKRPNEAEVFAFDLVNLLNVNEQITGVTAAVSVKSGVDAGASSMPVGTALFTGTKVSQKVGAGLAGNYYYLIFTVTTTSQTLELVGVIPVTTGA